ncbi:uncharacterized protein E0L32_008704 [Thyridium curvatum]|uniref:RGS domain-containing protein n=1 Tax=Thyridium curvatum TaxID=1093900 RepID=A0A507AZ52_9PEZI|nr:uncharacterized protein E0L32_008704 [Thyridium curvatum]TPX10299.1 hypothetical protein E0L32_008704 [Thyridium curvatum]
MRLPSWLTWYKKPEYRDIKEYSTAVGTGRRQPSPDGRNKTAIPSRLKLDRVLENKTCSPMSLYDFYMYLKYIEFSAENLEFYIWFKNYEADYVKNGGLDSDKASFHSDSTSSVAKLGEQISSSTTELADLSSADPEIARETLEKITQLISSEALCSNGKCERPSVADRLKNLTKSSESPKPSSKETAAAAAAGAPTLDILGADATAINTTSRGGLNAVIQAFLVPGSKKELNIPPSMRDEALAALQNSSDPRHLRPVADHVYLLLRNCSHRNFVRLGVSNGTFETICVATSLGIVLTLAGFLCVLLRAFAAPRIHSQPRWDAFAAWPLWWLGISLILSGLRGSCFFLLLFTRRQPLPWERFDDGASMHSQRSSILHRVSRLMIFDRKLRVKDVHLRRLQHKIVIQSLLGGAIFASLGVLVFIFLPVWSDPLMG